MGFKIGSASLESFMKRGAVRLDSYRALSGSGISEGGF